MCAAHLGRTGIVEQFIADFERQPETFLHYFPSSISSWTRRSSWLAPGCCQRGPSPSRRGILAFEPELADRAVVEVEESGTDLS